MAAYTEKSSEGTTQHKDAVIVLIGDVQFGLVIAVVATTHHSIDAIYQIKTNHELFPK